MPRRPPRLDAIPARTEGGFHVVVETPRGAACFEGKAVRVVGWSGPDAAERLLSRGG
jgi:hypothetical protein